MATELEKAKEIYKSGSAAVKTALDGIFGASAFAGKITDRVQSFEAALPIFKKKKFKDKLYLILQKRKADEFTAIDKLIVIAEVWREDWKADWNNPKQYKYYPWFKYDSKLAGFGFSDAFYDYDYSLTGVGSRLCFPDSEMAEKFGRQFLPLINDFLIIKQ